MKQRNTAHVIQYRLYGYKQFFKNIPLLQLEDDKRSDTNRGKQEDYVGGQ